MVQQLEHWWIIILLFVLLLPQLVAFSTALAAGYAWRA